MKYAFIVAGLAVALMTSGCMSGYYAHREHRQMAQRDTLLPPPMTVDDVIALAKDSVGDEVIINQMKATHSYFQLTNEDIRDLKKNGVSERVVNAMIKTSNQPRNVREREASWNPMYVYPDSYWYPYSAYYSPWYPRAYLGFTYRGGYYGGYHHFGGGYRFGGGRVRMPR